MSEEQQLVLQLKQENQYLRQRNEKLMEMLATFATMKETFHAMQNKFNEFDFKYKQLFVNDNTAGADNNATNTQESLTSFVKAMNDNKEVVLAEQIFSENNCEDICDNFLLLNPNLQNQNQNPNQNQSHDHNKNAATARGGTGQTLALTSIGGHNKGGRVTGSGGHGGHCGSLTGALVSHMTGSGKRRTTNCYANTIECSFGDCSYSTCCKKNFDRHKASHLEVKRFACNWQSCQYSTCVKSHFTIHMRTHTGEKPYSCDWTGCSYSAASSSQVSRHKRIHYIQNSTNHNKCH